MTTLKLTPKDYASGLDVKWCPGCGDYAILAALQTVLADLNLPKEEHVFVSGIGCSSRAPYYLSTYGFHTLHGRAMPVATGVKLANPKLTVWVITGDGDALSIGAGHFLHTFRRNIDLKVLLFNNRIYGLTKGQVSPTSEHGKITKSSPEGKIETAANPLALALAAGATFAARSLAVDRKTLTAAIAGAARHRGSSIVEILQDCAVFNSGAYDALWNKEERDRKLLFLQDGQPLVFDKGAKAVTFRGDGPEVIPAEGTPLEAFNPSDYAKAQALATIDGERLPLPVGVLYRSDQPTLDDLVQRSLGKRPSEAELSEILGRGDVWEIN